VVNRADLRHEIAALLRFMRPAEGQRSEARGGFDPIGFLASLADKVVPELSTPPEADVPVGGRDAGEARRG
jgi:hypothetical protein